jgi:hypothetical protein
VIVDEAQRRLGRLVVALDRRRLAMSLDALVSDRHMDDVRIVGRLAGDDERLRELQPDDPCVNLHQPSLLGGWPTRSPVLR